jgi:hypothetical protein
MGEGDMGIRNMYMLSFVSFLTDVSSKRVFSILPDFILGWAHI